MFKGFSALAAGGLLLGLLGGAPIALAAQHANTGGNGVTSGQAVGTNVAPSTAVQKHNNRLTMKKHNRNQAMAGATAAGAPGVSAKRGTEAGPMPSHHGHHHMTTAKAGSTHK